MRYVDLGTPSRRLNEKVARGLIRGRSVFGGRRYRRFLIVGVARTGSTLLLSLLNAHSQALAFGELFRGDGQIGWDKAPFLTYQSPQLQRMHEDRPLEFLQTEVFRKWPAEVAAVGFKLFYYHAQTGAQASVWDYLRDDPELAIFHIKRLNILEQYLSLRVAHATNVWSASTAPAGSAEPVRLDPEACRRHFEEVRAQEEACDAFFGPERIETVTYEDLVANRDAVMARMTARLGLAPEPVAAGTVRQRTRPLSQAIANYDQLAAHFANSAWERFFRQPDTVGPGQEAA
jgi:LPS sulfotransferase NodH